MVDRSDTVAFIFARGGSKGLPGKNTKMFAGKPLIAWAIEHAQAISEIRRVIVSTDSNEIAQIARLYGADVPFMRPSHLAEDDSPELLSWRHALEFLLKEEGKLPDVMLSLPATSPLRQPQDTKRCLDCFAEGGADVVIAVTESHRSPFFNMVKVSINGFADVVIPVKHSISRRQDVPEVFDVTTVAYVVNPIFVLAHESLFEGRVKAVFVPKERSLDIDTSLDFQMAEYLFMRGN